MQIKAWCWQSAGAPENLSLRDVDLPELEDNELLIRNTSIGLNPVDWKLIKNGHPLWEPGHIPGVDGAGIIEQKGVAVHNVSLGQKICYHTDLSRNGSFATHTIVKADRVIAVPHTVSDTTAAAFPCPCLTAWQAFQKVPEVSGKNIFINGAGSSVGYFAMQLFIQAGARVFVSASVHHHRTLLKMGAIRAVDYKENGWAKRIFAELNGAYFDAIVDVVSSKSAVELMPFIGYYGHMITVLGRVEQNPLPPFSTCLSLHEIALGAFHKYASSKQIAQLMLDGTHLLEQVGAGLLKLRPLSVGVFSELNVYLQQMMEGRLVQKPVILIPLD